MRAQTWAVVPLCVAVLCVVAGVYILVYERRRGQAETVVVQRPPAPSLHAPPPPNRPRNPLRRPPPHADTPPPSAPPSTSPPPRLTGSNNTRTTLFQRMFEDAVRRGTGDDELMAPAVQVRQPLVVPHKLEYTLRHRKYTFQSDQRDQLVYPNPAYYRLKLVAPLRNVVAITLSSGVFPITEYNVNAYNNWLDINVGGMVYSIQLPQGDYTDTTLAGGLQAAITGYGAPLNTFTVTLDPLTRKLTVANPAPFSLLFRSGPHVNTSLWQVMGFLQLDTPAAVTALAPGVIDLSGTLAIDMFIDEVSCNIDSTDNAVARISLQRNVALSALTFFTPTNYGVLRKFWPIGRLQYLTFQFMVKVSELQPDGQVVVKYRLYDFNERNHTMQLAISCKEYESPQDEFVELDPQS